MAPPAGQKSPLRLASVGTYSGPVGTVLLPTLLGAQVWVRYINGKGGLNGHPVELVVYDDGADPARHRAQVQEAIEHKKVAAFLQNGEGITGRSSVDYVTAKRVPVIGAETASEWMYSSPMYFPQVSHGAAMLRTIPPSIASQVLPRGAKKLGSLVCVEVSTCEGAAEEWAKQVKSLGMEYVYRARASLAQPDYTAECLAAKGAAAEIFYVVLDKNSLNRVSTACARQGYNPIFAVPGAAVADDMKTNRNLEGMVTGVMSFPWFQTNTLAALEYQDSMRTYGRGELEGSGPTLGWTSGKLLERAAVTLPEPPTSEAVLAGLWSLNGDTLGGLTYPQAFGENQPAPQVSCWYSATVKDGKWLSPDNFKLNCL